jgi:hypothetical protein
LEHYCNSDTTTEPRIPENALLIPGIYKAKLNKILTPSGNAVSLTIQIRRPWLLALFPAALGIALAFMLKRHIGVVSPTEALLFSIHNTTKQYLDYAEVSPNNRFDYEIGSAFKIRAWHLEERVRQVRANTTLLIDVNDENYKQLVKDIADFRLVPDQWRDLIRSLQNLEGKKTDLETYLKTNVDVDLSALLKEVQVCYDGQEISRLNKEVDAQESHKHLGEARRLAETTLKKLLERLTTWDTKPRPKLEAWSQKLPAINTAQAPKKSWFKQFLSIFQIPRIHRVKTLKFQQRILIFGGDGYSTATWKDTIFGYIIPGLGLLIAAYFEVYANNPGFGDIDYLKAFSWGFVSNTVAQIFFAAIERLPIGKLFGG